MALAYTAPNWTDGSGEGISASNLQAISNCIEGLVQGSDKAVTHISMNASVITLTFADGTQETVNATDLKGIVSVEKTGTVGELVDVYTITFTDGTTTTYTITNGADGQDGQDGQDGADGRDGAIQYTAGEGISIVNNVISATGGGGGSTVTIDHNGTASTSAYRSQRVGIDGVYTDVDGSVYMESTANSASFVFSNAIITATSAIDVYTDTWGDNPSSVSVSSNTCTVTFDSAQTRTVRIYIK